MRSSAASTSRPCHPWCGMAAERDNFVGDVQKMRRRVVDNIPAAQVERELKLGPGGLRDVEFAVQLLQLVHGRSDATLHSATTLDALAALAAGGYVGRADAAQLDEAYRFLRAMEHRIQLYRLRRTHLVPEDEADLRRLGRLARAAHRARRQPQQGMEAARLGGAAAAREALLPAPPGRRRPARTGRDPAQRPRRRAPPRSARLRRPGRGPAPPGGPVLGREPQGRHPTHPAARPVGLVRRLRRPRRRAARLPQGLRRARQDPLVPEAAARRGRRRREPGPGPLGRPARPRPAPARPRGGGHPRRPRRARTARPRPPGAGDTGRGRPGRDRRGRGRGGPRGAPPRTVPHRRRRPHRLVRDRGQAGRTGPGRPRRPGRQRGHRPERGHHRGRPARGRTGRVGRHPADPVRRHRHGPLRRSRTRLRLRRGRPVRARAPRGRGGTGGLAGRRQGGRRDAPAPPTPHHRPAVAHRRRSAPGGQVRPAGAHAQVVRGVLPSLVAGLGESGAAAGRGRWQATRTSGPGSSS